MPHRVRKGRSHRFLSVYRRNGVLVRAARSVMNCHATRPDRDPRLLTKLRLPVRSISSVLMLKNFIYSSIISM